MLDLESNERGVILRVRAYAGSRKNAVLGIREGMLRVAVTAAPEKGKANRAIITVLGRALGLPKSAFELISGDTSPKKRYLINGTTENTVREVFQYLC
ncbi:MAG: DUF167 family protein [Planctomycetes bacterium]|nr:DUF167 family protein [Planctomycetota bacterium]